VRQAARRGLAPGPDTVGYLFPVRFTDVIAIALGQLRASKLRSFFTLLGIIVSVAFLVAVVAIIQGMNAYVRENLADALIGANAFQVRRTPIMVGRFDDEQWERLSRRPRITAVDADVVRRAIPDAQAIGLQSGWPTPIADVVWNARTLGGVLIFGVTAPFQEVQDYRFRAGRALSDIDVDQRRTTAVIGADVADKLFEHADPVGREVRIHGNRVTIVGVIARKGQVLGQSFDGFVLLPFTTFESMFGRRQTTVISVKMANAASVASGMARAEEAMRVAHRLRPEEENNFSVDTADALVAFWKQLTSLLFKVIPTVVAIGVVVGGIVIMNIMLMAVNERTHEIGIRKAVGATARDISRQFLAESIALATLGGLIGAVSGWLFALMIAAVSPLPARVTAWSVALALALGAGVGLLFGVYPAKRAAALDPVAAMRAE
jgi:putative ABC transport system permease protein